MQFLSPQIESLIKNKKKVSLIKKENSCGIFQDYGKNVQQIQPMEKK